MMYDAINKIIMDEIGLTVDNYAMVIDQDSREYLKFKDKNIKYSSRNCIPISTNDIAFDPGSNRNMMSCLFEHFTRKIEEEGTYVSIFYERIEGYKSRLEARVNGEVVSSSLYSNASLKYVDMIMRLNGSTVIDLTPYDTTYPLKDKGNKNKKVGY